MSFMEDEEHLDFEGSEAGSLMSETESVKDEDMNGLDPDVDEQLNKELEEILKGAEAVSDAEDVNPASQSDHHDSFSTSSPQKSQQIEIPDNKEESDQDQDIFSELLKPSDNKEESFELHPKSEDDKDLFVEIEGSKDEVDQGFIAACEPIAVKTESLASPHQKQDLLVDNEDSRSTVGIREEEASSESESEERPPRLYPAEEPVIEKHKRKLDKYLDPEDQFDLKYCIVRLSPPNKNYLDILRQIKKSQPDLFPDGIQPWESETESETISQQVNLQEGSFELDDVDKIIYGDEHRGENEKMNTSDDLDLWAVEEDMNEFDDDADNYKRKQASRAEKAQREAEAKAVEEQIVKKKESNILDTLSKDSDKHPLVQKIGPLLESNQIEDAFDYFCSDVDYKREWSLDYAQEVLKKLTEKLILKGFCNKLESAASKLEKCAIQDETFWETIIYAAKGQLDKNEKRSVPKIRGFLRKIYHYLRKEDSIRLPIRVAEILCDNKTDVFNTRAAPPQGAFNAFPPAMHYQMPQVPPPYVNPHPLRPSYAPSSFGPSPYNATPTPLTQIETMSRPSNGLTPGENNTTLLFNSDLDVTFAPPQPVNHTPFDAGLPSSLPLRMDNQDISSKEAALLSALKEPNIRKAASMLTRYHKTNPLIFVEIAGKAFTSEPFNLRYYTKVVEELINDSLFSFKNVTKNAEFTSFTMTVLKACLDTSQITQAESIMMFLEKHKIEFECEDPVAALEIVIPLSRKIDLFIPAIYTIQKICQSAQIRIANYPAKMQKFTQKLLTPLLDLINDHLLAQKPLKRHAYPILYEVLNLYAAIRQKYGILQSDCLTEKSINNAIEKCIVASFDLEDHQLNLILWTQHLRKAEALLPNLSALAIRLLIGSLICLRDLSFKGNKQKHKQVTESIEFLIDAAIKRKIYHLELIRHGNGYRLTFQSFLTSVEMIELITYKLNDFRAGAGQSKALQLTVEEAHSKQAIIYLDMKVSEDTMDDAPVTYLKIDTSFNGAVDRLVRFAFGPYFFYYPHRPLEVNGFKYVLMFAYHAVSLKPYQVPEPTASAEEIFTALMQGKPRDMDHEATVLHYHPPGEGPTNSSPENRPPIPNGIAPATSGPIVRDPRIRDPRILAHLQQSSN